jgi:RNA polymerase subunit RPABC4/transcription elongation factor Spt4
MTNTCPRCNYAVRPGAKFCPNCRYAIPVDQPHPASPVEIPCPNCGAAIRQGAKFCPSCGQSVTPARPAPPPQPFPQVPARAPIQPAVKTPVYYEQPYPGSPPQAVPAGPAKRTFSRVWLAAAAGLILILVIAVVLIISYLDQPVVVDQPTPNLAATLTAAITAIPQIVP